MRSIVGSKAACLAMLILACSGPAAAEDAGVRSITVVGMGEAAGPPDRATINAGVQTLAPTVIETARENQVDCRAHHAGAARRGYRGGRHPDGGLQHLAGAAARPARQRRNQDGRLPRQQHRAGYRQEGRAAGHDSGGRDQCGRQRDPRHRLRRARTRRRWRRVRARPRWQTPAAGPRRSPSWPV